jgi:short-subunit dehydrogenase
MLTGRRVDMLERLSREVGGRSLQCDLANRQDVGRLSHAANEANLDVLVANAALPASGVITDLTQEEIDRMLDVNLRAPIALTRALVPGMIERGRGHIVFISSLAGKAASPASSIYSATKFGLRGFALGLREDLHPHGVGVSVLLPGFISDAGLFADAGDIKLPPGVGTRTSEQVANGVIRAIERNRAEIQVAPLPLRLAASFAGVAPGLAATGSRLMGSDKVAADIAAGQLDKRS